MQEQVAIQKLLQERLAEVRVRNPSYSVRAFSMKLGLSSSALSEILRGRRQVSRKVAARIAERLCLAPPELAALLELFPERRRYGQLSGAFADELTSGLSPSERVLSPALELTADQFHLISDWHHFAILSLLETRGARAEASWIARRLGIRDRDAVSGLERLVRLGMIEVRSPARFKLTERRLVTTDGVPNASVRKNHADGLELAQRSLEGDPVATRDFTGLTLSFDAQRMGEARRMIRDFRGQFDRRFAPGAKSDVYRLSIQFLPLTKKEKS